MIDESLAAGRLDGYQYDGMPDDRDTWRLVLAGLDEMAAARYGGRLVRRLRPAHRRRNRRRVRRRSALRRLAGTSST